MVVRGVGIGEGNGDGSGDGALDGGAIDDGAFNVGGAIDGALDDERIGLGDGKVSDKKVGGGDEVDEVVGLTSEEEGSAEGSAEGALVVGSRLVAVCDGTDERRTMRSGSVVEGCALETEGGIGLGKVISTGARVGSALGRAVGGLTVPSGGITVGAGVASKTSYVGLPEKIKEAIVGLTSTRP